MRTHTKVLTKTTFWRQAAAWMGIVALLATTLLISPLSVDNADAQAVQFSVSAKVIQPLILGGAKNHETVLEIIFGADEAGQTLQQIKLDFEAISGSPSWTQATSTSSVLENLIPLSSESGVTLWRDHPTDGTQGQIDLGTDTFIPLAANNYGANGALILAPDQVTTISEGDKYLVGLLIDDSGLTPNDEFTVSLISGGVVTSGTDPVVATAITTAPMKVVLQDEWGYDMADLVSVKALDNGLAQGNRVEFLFNRSLSASSFYEGANPDYTFYACDASWICNSWGVGAVMTLSQIHAPNDRVTINLGSGPTVTSGDQLSMSVPITVPGQNWESWAWIDDVALDLTSPTLASVLYKDDDGDGAYSSIGDCATFTFSEEMDDSSISGDNFSTSIPNSAAVNFGKVSTLWFSENQVDVCLLTNETDTIGATFDPANSVKDISGNIDNTTIAPTLTVASVSSAKAVNLSDNAVGYGFELADVNVIWSGAETKKCEIYLLPADKSWSIDYFPINQNPIACAAGSFDGTTDAVINSYEDSRGDPDDWNRTQWYYLDSSREYVVYVAVTSALSRAEMTLSNTATAKSNELVFGGDAGVDETYTNDYSAPYIHSRAPYWGQTVGNNNKKVAIRWSEPMNKDSAGVIQNFSAAYDSDGDGTTETSVTVSDATYLDDIDTTVLTLNGLPTAANTKVTVTANQSITNDLGTVMGYNDSFDFYVSGVNDGALPTIVSANVANGDTGVSTYNSIEIEVSEEINPATLTTSTVTLSPAATYKVKYEVGTSLIRLSFSQPLNASTTYTLNTSDGAGVRDLAGNAMTMDSRSFTTGAADTTAPTISYGWGDEVGIVVGFDTPMNESSVTNASNWTLKDSLGTPVNITNASFVWHEEWQELDIDGLSGLTGQHTLTANNVTAANGVAIDSTGGANVVTLDIVNSASYGFDNIDHTAGVDTYTFGYMEAEAGAYTTDFMNFSPSWVWNKNVMAGATTTFEGGFPIKGALDDGSTVVIKFPSGFDVSSAAENTDYWASSDMNGPDTGIVTVSGVAKSQSAKTVTLTLNVKNENGAPTSTSADTYLDWALKQIVNTSTPSSVDWASNSGGYSLIITAKTSKGVKVVDEMETERFEIIAAGTGIISGTVVDGNGGPVSGAMVYAEGMTGQNSATTAADGTYTISSLPTNGGGQTQVNYWLWVDAPDGYLPDYSWKEVTLSDSSPAVSGKQLTVTGSDCTISGTITHTGVTGKVRVWASGNTWLEKTITLGGNSTNYTLALSEGEYWMGLDPFNWENSDFSPPPSEYVTCTAATSPVDHDISISVGAHKITGTVTDQSGNGLGKVHVSAYAYEGGSYGGFVDTAADGTYTLKNLNAGKYTVEFWKEGLSWSPGIEAVVDAANPTATVNKKFQKPDSTIQGTVVDETDSPIAWASVEACQSASEATTFKECAWAQTGNDGKYTLYVAAGTYDISTHAWPQGVIPAETSGTNLGVVVAAATDVKNIDFKYDPAALRSISGTMKDADGNGVAWANVWCDEQNTTTGKHTGNYGFDMTGDDGTFKITVLPNTSGVTQYICSGNDWGSGGETNPITVDVSSANATNQTLTFATQYNVTITVSGAPTSESWVYVDIWDEATFRGNFADIQLTNGAGSKTIKMADGTYKAHASIGGTNIESNLTVSGAAVAFPIDVSATFDEGITVSGTVTSSGLAVGGAWVDVYNSNTGEVWGTTASPNGTYSQQVPAGTWEVRAESNGYASGGNTIVNTTGTVNPTLTAADATITGTVYKSDGTTAASTGMVWAESTTGSVATAVVEGDGTYTLDVPSDSGTWTVSAGTAGKKGQTTASAGASTANVTAATSIEGYKSNGEVKSASTDPDEGGKVDGGENDMTLNFPATALGAGDPVNVKMEPAVGPVTNTKKAVNTVEISAKQGATSVNKLNKASTLEMTLDNESINDLLDTNAITVNSAKNDLEKMKVGSWSATKNDYETAASMTMKVTVDGTAVNKDTFMTSLEADNNYCTDGTRECEVIYSAKIIHFTVYGLVTTSDSTAPSAPAALAATASDGSVALSWTANSESDLLEYEVYRSTSASVTAVDANQLNTSQVATNSYTDSTVTNGTTYYYIVTAVDTAGNESTASSEVSAAPAGATTTTTSGGGGGGGSTTYAPSSDDDTSDDATDDEAADDEVTTDDEAADDEVTTDDEAADDEVTTDDEAADDEATDDEAADDEAADVEYDYGGHWAEEYIDQILETGIAEGKSEGEFAPNSMVTREELTKMVVNASGYDVPESVDEAPFSDVDVDRWSATYITVAKEHGLIEGYEDGTFDPTAEVNRAEALKVIMESEVGVDIILDSSRGLLTNYGLSENPFTDVDLEEWYAEYVLYAYIKDIVTGYANEPGIFGPDRSMTRAEFSKVLVLFMGL